MNIIIIIVAAIIAAAGIALIALCFVHAAGASDRAWQKKIEHNKYMKK